MTESLLGKVALITGAGRREGLGHAIALELARRGADVAVTDLVQSRDRFPETAIGSRDELDASAEEIRELGRRALALSLDVTSAEDVERGVESVVSELGRVDILVNNAGVGYLMALATEMSEEDWDTTLAVNLKGPFLCSKAVGRRLIAQGDGGRIVNIASQAAKSAIARAAGYCSSKHGLIGLTRVLAIELGPHGITVNAVCPNHVTTGLGAWQNQYFSASRLQEQDDYLDRMRDRIPLGRLCTQQDVANAVCWLAGPEAAFVNGDALNVTGGEEMH